MATRYEYYNTGDDGNFAVLATSPPFQWAAQTFTVGATPHMISSAKVYLMRWDASATPGTITLWLLATDGGGKPSGAALASGTRNGNGIVINPNKEFFEITLSSPYALEANTKYAIALKTSSDSLTHPTMWRKDLSGAYAVGHAFISQDGGATWNYQDVPRDNDLLFEIWGTHVDGVKVEIGGLDVSAYVLGIHTERGEDKELAEATTGICQLTLDNFNGDFSPENAGGAFYPDLRIGAIVEVFETSGGIDYPLFYGRIDSIDPLAEPTSPYAYIVALDGQDDMKGTKISTVLRIDTDSGTLAEDVLDAVGWAGGAARDIDAGVDVLQLGWFHKVDGLKAIRILENVEGGRFFVTPTGVATWHNRHHRLTGAGLVSQYDLGEKAVGLDYEYSKRQVKNVIDLRGRRYYSGGGKDLFSGYDLATLDDDLIWSAHAGDAGAPYVPQQTTLTLWADMNSPLASYTALVKGTHWDANTVADKSGVDVGGDITLVQTQYGQSVKLGFTNGGSVGAYLVVPDSPPLGAPDDRTVLVYGTMYGVEVMAISDEDTTSQDDYGYRSLDVDLPFKSNPNDIVSYAQYLKNKLKDAVPRAVSVRINHRTDWPDTTIKLQCLTREISDRVTIASTRLGFDRDFYINKVVHDYLLNEAGMLAETTWFVERAEGTIDGLYWILGEVGFSEVGETTTLGF